MNIVKASYKSDWKMVKFGDVVRNAKLVERNPINAGIKRIVAIEHIEPENLHITNWNNPEDGTSFTRKFLSGQTLFVKRRAYQRKVAYAEFDGICSGDILTFESKDTKTLLTELLPFICQTDAFFDHALGTSAGSLSPRTSWTAIKEFEFPLPPLAEQKRIAEILWAADEVYNHQSESLNSLLTMKRTILNSLTTKGDHGGRTQHTRLGHIAGLWKILTVDDITSLCQYGLSIQLHETAQYPILRMMNYDDGHITASDLKYVDLNKSDFSTFKLCKGDILFNRTNSADLVGKVGIFELDGDFVFASYLIRLRADGTKVIPDYLNFYLNSDLGQKRLLAYATPGVSQTNISAGNLKKVLVPVPPIEEQQEIVHILKKIESNKTILREHVQNSKSFLFKLINSLVEKHVNCMETLVCNELSNK